MDTLDGAKSLYPISRFLLAYKYKTRMQFLLNVTRFKLSQKKLFIFEVGINSGTTPCYQGGDILRRCT